MMKSSSLKICLAGSLAISSFAAIASDKQGISIIPGYGFYNFDSEYSVDDRGIPNIGLEYRHNNRLGLEMNYGQTDTKSGSSDTEWKYAHLDGLMYFMPNNRMQPYVAAGIGEGTFSNELSNQDSDETLANLGGGVKFAFNKALSLRADLRAVNSIDNETTSGLAMLSLAYQLTGNSGNTSGPDFDISQNADSASEKLALVVDADGDGIADSLDECSNTPVNSIVSVNGCQADDASLAKLDQAKQEAAEAEMAAAAALTKDSDNDGIADAQDQCPSTGQAGEVDSNGCSIQLALTAPEFYFDPNSASVSEAELNEVREIATFMKRYNDTIAVIEGYSDNTGSDQLNKQLSAKRAENIRQILVSEFGVDPKRIQTIGHGSKNPVASNQTIEGRQQNRRVTATIAKPDAL